MAAPCDPHNTSYVDVECGVEKDSSEKLSRLAIFVNISLIAVSIIVVLLQIMSMGILHKCKRMPFQIKELSYNFIVSDIMFHLTNAVISACLLILGMEFRDILFLCRAIVCTFFLLISLAAVAGLTMERLLAVCKTMTYTTLVNKKNIRIMSVHIWTTHTILLILSIAIPYVVSCYADILSQLCHVFASLLWFRLTIAALYVIYHTFIVISYVQINKVLYRHLRQISQQTVFSVSSSEERQQQNKTNTSSAIIRVVIAYELLNIPILLHSLIFVFIPSVEQHDYQKIFNVVSYTINIIGSLISLYVYVFKIKECKLLFLKMWLSRSQRFKLQIQQLQQEVYGLSSVRI